MLQDKGKTFCRNDYLQTSTSKKEISKNCALYVLYDFDIKRPNPIFSRTDETGKAPGRALVSYIGSPGTLVRYLCEHYHKMYSLVE